MSVLTSNIDRNECRGTVASANQWPDHRYRETRNRRLHKIPDYRHYRQFLGSTSAIRKSDLLASISLLLVRKSDLLVSISLLLVRKSDFLASVSLLLVSKSDFLVSILLLLVSKSDFLVADELAAFEIHNPPVLRIASRLDKLCSLIDRAVLIMVSTGASALRCGKVRSSRGGPIPDQEKQNPNQEMAFPGFTGDVGYARLPCSR